MKNNKVFVCVVLAVLCHDASIYSFGNRVGAALERPLVRHTAAGALSAAAIANLVTALTNKKAKEMLWRKSPGSKKAARKASPAFVALTTLRILLSLGLLGGAAALEWKGRKGAAAPDVDWQEPKVDAIFGESTGSASLLATIPPAPLSTVPLSTVPLPMPRTGEPDEVVAPAGGADNGAAPGAGAVVVPAGFAVLPGFTQVKSEVGYLERGGSEGAYTWTLPDVRNQCVVSKAGVAYADHNANYRFAELENLGKPHQDAFLVDVVCDGAWLRACIADGTGTHQEIENILWDWDSGASIPDDNYHSGGAAAARYIIDAVARQKIQITSEIIQDVDTQMKERNRDIVERILSRVGAAKLLRERMGSIKGGSCALISLTLSPDRWCLFNLVGDCGAFVLRRDAGGHVDAHCVLSGHPAATGKQMSPGCWKVGDTNDSTDCSDVVTRDYRLSDDDEFVVLACDGLFDVFAHSEKKKIAPVDLVQELRGMKLSESVFHPGVADAGDATRYITPAWIYKSITRSLAAGINPASPIIARAKELGEVVTQEDERTKQKVTLKKYDDLTVIVVDVRKRAGVHRK